MEGGGGQAARFLFFMFFFALSLWHTSHRVPLHLNYFQMQVFSSSFFYFVWRRFKGILEKKNEARISISCASATSNFVFKKSITCFFAPPPIDLCVFSSRCRSVSEKSYATPFSNNRYPSLVCKSSVRMRIGADKVALVLKVIVIRDK